MMSVSDQTIEVSKIPGLSQPAIRALAGARYQRLDQLAGAPASELLKLHGFGPKAIRVINEALARAALPPLQS